MNVEGNGGLSAVGKARITPPEKPVTPVVPEKKPARPDNASKKFKDLELVEVHEKNGVETRVFTDGITTGIQQVRVTTQKEAK